MHMIARRLSMVLFAATLPCATAMAAETRVALVIGNAEYERVPVLHNPPNDAADVTAALERLGFSVTLLENADQAALRRGLQQFARAASVAQLALVYYAGHGIEVDRRNFLVPVDARLASDADIEFETVPLDLVLQSVSRASFRLVILDACRENPFARTMQSADTTRSIGRGLALIEPPGGMLVAYSAKEGTLAEDGDGRNSPYAQALLGFLEQPGLEMGIMFRHVRDKVLAATGGRQEPFTYGSLPKEGIYLRSSQPQPSAGDTRISELVVAEQPSPDVDQPAGQAPIVDEVDEIRWTVRATDVYSGADEASAVVRRLQPAVEVEVTGTVRGSNWLRVIGADGGIGYVAGAALIDRYPVEDVEGLFRVERHANVRSGPGVGYERVHRLEPGDEVAVTGRFHETDWLRITLDGGAVGYVTSPMLGDRLLAADGERAEPESTPGSDASEKPVQASVLRAKNLRGMERAYEAGDHEKVVEYVNLLEQSGADLPPTVWYFQGKSYAQLGRIDEASQVLTRYAEDAGEGGERFGEVVDLLLDLDERMAADDEAYEQAREQGTAFAYAAYLRAYPHGRHGEEAQRLRTVAADDEAYELARRGGTSAGYRAYLLEYPSGRHAAEARRLEAEAKDDEAYERAQRTNTAAAYGTYLTAYPSGRHAAEARQAQTAARDDEAYTRARNTGTAAAFGGYLNRYPNGQHAAEARRLQSAARDDEAYEQAKTAGTAVAYATYLRSHPSGRHTTEARRLEAEAKDDEAYERAQRTDTAAAYHTYLRTYPRGRHAAEARRSEAVTRDDEAYEQARTAGTAAAYATYLRSQPSGRHTTEARRLEAEAKDDEAYERAQRTDTAAAYDTYLRTYPRGRHAAEARRLRTAATRREEAERLTRPGRRFRDCAECPEMIVVPSGSFMMGSPASEEGRDDNEGPRHRVTIREPFAVGVYEVTFAEWDACVEHGACSGDLDDAGWGRGSRPAINVSWNDAQNYVAWISGMTGKKYRLLSEAEWEYVARAGTTTRYYYGNTISLDQANHDPPGFGDWYGKTTPVDHFRPNAFGVHDMHGNAWEWVQDCWNQSYTGAPTNGAAWERGDCRSRLLRGGSWTNDPKYLRSADRRWSNSDSRSNILGFRIAQSLTS